MGVSRRTEDEVVDEIGNDDLQFCLLDRVEVDDQVRERLGQQRSQDSFEIIERLCERGKLPSDFACVVRHDDHEQIDDYVDVVKVKEGRTNVRDREATRLFARTSHPSIFISHSLANCTAYERAKQSGSC